MKRSVVAGAVVAVILACSSAQAGLDILWSAAFGFKPQGGDGSIGILNPSVNPSQMALAQLVFTPDDMINPAMEGSIGFTSGNDMVWASMVLQNGVGSSEYGDFSAPNYQNSTFTPGWVYIRVFEADTPQITMDSLYFDSATLELKDLEIGLGFPQSLDTSGDPPMTQELNLLVQAVPEPGTMALCLVGLGGLMARRRRHV